MTKARALTLAVIAGLLPTGLVWAGLIEQTFALRIALVVAIVGGLVAVWLAIRDRRVLGTALSVIFTILAIAGVAWNGLLLFFSGASFGHGRPFRRGGRAVTARARRGGAWGDETRPAVDGLSPAAREELAAAWTRDALAEHASVAAFARLTLDLLAVGAPAAIVDACTAAQRDEIAHARVAFAMASAYAGRPVGPGPMPEAALGETRDVERSVRLRQLAVDALRDGCWLEQASADALHARAREAADPAVTAALARLADDEDRHAGLAWDILAWCLTEEPTLRAPVAQEIATLEVHGRAEKAPLLADAARRAAARAAALLCPR